MKVVIACYDTQQDFDRVSRALELFNTRYSLSEIVVGSLKESKVCEKLSKELGVNNNYMMPDWKIYGKSAAVICTSNKAKYSDAAIIVLDDNINNSNEAHLTQLMNRFCKLQKPLFLYFVITDNLVFLENKDNYGE